MKYNIYRNKERNKFPIKTVEMEFEAILPNPSNIFFSFFEICGGT